jgi:hypothetical protein
MNGVWIVVGLGVAVALALAAIARSLGRGRQSDLGSVSDHWVAEHRLSQPNDSR